MPGIVLRALQMLTHLILTTTSEMNRQEAKCNQSDALGNLRAGWKDTELPSAGSNSQAGSSIPLGGWGSRTREAKHRAQASGAEGSGEQTLHYGSFKKSVTGTYS